MAKLIAENLLKILGAIVAGLVVAILVAFIARNGWFGLNDDNSRTAESTSQAVPTVAVPTNVPPTAAPTNVRVVVTSSKQLIGTPTPIPPLGKQLARALSVSGSDAQGDALLEVAQHAVLLMDYWTAIRAAEATPYNSEQAFNLSFVVSVLLRMVSTTWQLKQQVG